MTDLENMTNIVKINKFQDLNWARQKSKAVNTHLWLKDEALESEEGKTCNRGD